MSARRFSSNGETDFRNRRLAGRQGRNRAPAIGCRASIAAVFTTVTSTSKRRALCGSVAGLHADTNPEAEHVRRLLVETGSEGGCSGHDLAHLNCGRLAYAPSARVLQYTWGVGRPSTSHSLSRPQKKANASSRAGAFQFDRLPIVSPSPGHGGGERSLLAKSVPCHQTAPASPPAGRCCPFRPCQSMPVTCGAHGGSSWDRRSGGASKTSVKSCNLVLG